MAFKINMQAPRNILAFIFKEERRGSLVLLLAAVAALIFANAVPKNYNAFLDLPVHIGTIDMHIKDFVSEGLMAIFFLVASLEVKRELIDGELRSWQRASFPILAAIGGMCMPALFFALNNTQAPQNSGWAIPMATDIVIAVGVMGLLGDRVPKVLRIFLLTLAIVDDIGSILVIGLFYNHPSHFMALALAAITGVGLYITRKWSYWPAVFVVGGVIIWYCLTKAGISGTMAGVIVGFLMPLKARVESSAPLQVSEKIEDLLIPVTTFFIVPLFVFVNAGIQFSSIALSQTDSREVFIGVFCGLLLGKPAGIFLASWCGDRLKLARKPEGLRWSQLAGVGFLGGIGFTISLLIANLAYPHSEPLQSAAILGIFSASIVAGMVGLLLLFVTTKRNT